MSVPEKHRGKNGRTKVKRYWPGKAPEWEDDTDDVDITGYRKTEKAFEKSDDVAMMKDDRRLRRLAEGRVENGEEIRADHRRMHHAESVEEEHGNQEDDQAEIVSSVEEEADQEEEEERRRRILEKNLQRDQEEAESLIPAEEEEAEEWEESEYENDSTGGITMIRPVIIP